MDTSQKLLPLPKTYRPPMTWRIGVLIMYVLFGPVFGAALVFSIWIVISGQISSSDLLAIITIIFTCIVGISCLVCCFIYMLNQFYIRLEILPQGIVCISLKNYLYTPWENIVSYDFYGNSKRIFLREKAVNGSLDEGLQNNIAVYKVAPWYHWMLWADLWEKHVLLIPRSLWGFEDNSDNIRSVHKYIEIYAAHASQL